MPAAAASVRPDHATLERALAALGCACELETVAETGSTNSDLLARARTRQFSSPLLRVAGHQSAGRGRLGRRWLAAPGDALLFSLALPLTLPPAQVAAVTLACGVALAEACRAAGVPAGIKWPNDLWLAGRKLAGVLCELALDPAGRRSLIVGVGINWRLDAAARAALDAPAAALCDVIDTPDPVQPTREAWIARLTQALLAAVAEFRARGLAPFAARWDALDALHGQSAVVRQGATVLAQGEVCGIDAAGCLLLETGGVRRSFVSGEVSLRAAA